MNTIVTLTLVLALVAVAALFIRTFFKDRNDRVAAANEQQERRNEEYDALMEKQYENTKDHIYDISPRITCRVYQHEIVWINYRHAEGKVLTYTKVADLRGMHELTLKEVRAFEMIERNLERVEEFREEKQLKPAGFIRHVSFTDGEIRQYKLGTKRIIAKRNHMIVDIDMRDSGEYYVRSVGISVNLSLYKPDMYPLDTAIGVKTFEESISKNIHVASKLSPELDRLQELYKELRKYNTHRHKMIFAPLNSDIVLVHYDPHAMQAEPNNKMIEFPDLDE